MFSFILFVFKRSFGKGGSLWETELIHRIIPLLPNKSKFIAETTNKILSGIYYLFWYLTHNTLQKYYFFLK